MSNGVWRVGRSQPRNLYVDDVMVGVMVGTEEEAAQRARAIVAVMNRHILPGEITEDQPIGTRVVDRDDDVWIRGMMGWGLAAYPAPRREYYPLDTILSLGYGPLILLTEDES